MVLAVLWISAQAFLAAPISMRIGSRIGEELRERVEQLAGVALIIMAGLLIVLKPVHGNI